MTDPVLERLKELEARVEELETSSKVAGVVFKPTPGPEPTFQEVLEQARDVADEGYKRVRDYFLLELARNGYVNGSHSPSLDIPENDSGIRVRLQLYGEPIEHHDRFNEIRGGHPVQGQEYRRYGCRSDAPPGRLGYIEGELKVDFPGQFGHDPTTLNEWVEELRDNFGELLAAYCFGRCVALLKEGKETHRVGKIVGTQRLHEYKPLLQLVSQAMETDAVLAASFVQYLDRPSE